LFSEFYVAAEGLHGNFPKSCKPGRSMIFLASFAEAAKKMEPSPPALNIQSVLPILTWAENVENWSGESMRFLSLLLLCLVLEGCIKSKGSASLNCQTDLFSGFRDHSQPKNRDYDFLLEGGLDGLEDFTGAFYPLTSLQSAYYAIPDFARRWLPDTVKIWLDRDCGFVNFGVLRSNTLDSYNFVVKDNRLVARSCFACHAGPVDHQFVPGLYNSYIDSKAETAKMRSLPVKAKISEKLMLVMELVEEQETRGKNYGTYNIFPYLAAAGLNRKNISGFPELMPSIRATWIYVDPNPWWLNKYKKSYFRVGWMTGNNTYKLANGFHHATNVTDFDTIVRNMKKSIEYTKKVERYMQSMSSPAYPYPLHGDQVRLGSRIFHEKAVGSGLKPKTCAGCHGSYTKIPGASWSEPGHYTVNYKDKILDVGTDPAYQTYYRTVVQKVIDVDKALNPGATQNVFERLNEKSRQVYGEKFFYVEDDLVDYDGYVAPPLDGVWASGPYFHNGSVPTLWALLTPEERPALWRKVLDRMSLDQDAVGIPFAVMDRVVYQRLQAKDFQGLEFTNEYQMLRSTYATDVHGQSNIGHEFGKSWTAAEKRAVIEFLKSLSGPDMHKAPASQEGPAQESH
jgi:hypothetical protein